MKPDRVITCELCIEFREEGIIAVETRHLIFVFIGHELEELLGDSMGKRIARFWVPVYRAHLFNLIEITLCVARRLIRHESLKAILNHLIQCAFGISA